MGWTLSMAVAEGLSAAEVADRLDMHLTEGTIDYHGGPEPAVGVHRDGRAVVLDNPYDKAPALEDERRLARLSRTTKVVLFQINEHVNCGFYMTACWADGAMAWKITHYREEPETEELQVLGEPPADFAAIAGRYRARQAQADAAGDNICYLGAAVLDLFVSLTGIRYDMDGWWEDMGYRVLEPRR
jgi:hypothetical protein